ncbi:hypothetical protein BC936DRAFT_141148 [Jimgerdemannia flammicorona]|uniref:NodB homology domain-containing protein n=1 Tax=Jimgerdemannia flammicorona TaxID=994334 RepID=A0A433DGB3_9FUNG|nr:hypothetical protein BC936DRAFT_141148 [Jimgerdemannia flammicorona]
MLYSRLSIIVLTVLVHGALTDSLDTPVLDSAAAATKSGFVFKNTYPEAWKIAPTNTPLVHQWLAAINMSAVPKWPIVETNEDGDPVTGDDPRPCDWSWTGCINGDITVCPNKVRDVLYFVLGSISIFTTLMFRLYFAGFLWVDIRRWSNRVQATLFYIGSNVVRYPDIVRRACQAGHQIAVHSWSHHASTTLTNAQFVAEVKYTELAIREICGVTTRYFRPPYGDVDNRIRGLLKQMSYTNVIWDLDTNDWQLPPGGRRTLAQVNADFAKWIAKRHSDKTGHVCLEHELSANSITAAMKNLPSLQRAFKVLPVAACLGDAHPYHEPSVCLPAFNNSCESSSHSPSSPPKSASSSTQVLTAAHKRSVIATDNLSTIAADKPSMTTAAASLPSVTIVASGAAGVPKEVGWAVGALIGTALLFIGM